MDFEKIKTMKMAEFESDVEPTEQELRMKFRPDTVQIDMEEWPPLEIRPVTIIRREDWGALPPLTKIPELECVPVPTVCTTYTGRLCETTEQCMSAMRKMQRRHIQRGYPDIKYSFIVGGDGNVYEGRGWTGIPEKNKKYPKLWGFSYEIGLMWYRAKHYLDKPDDPLLPITVRNILRKERDVEAPPKEMWRVLEDLIEHGHEHGHIEEASSFYNGFN